MPVFKSRLGPTDKLGFGKWKGYCLDEIPESYLAWLYAQDWVEQSNPALYAYLESLDLMSPEDYRDEH